jgi:hypothetical protein
MFRASFPLNNLGTPSGFFGFGTLPGTLTPRHPEAAQTLAQPTVGGLPPSPDFLAQPPLPSGLAQFRSGREDDIPGFNFRLLEDVVPARNFIESESSPLRHATPWSDRAFPTPSDYPDATATPSGLEEFNQAAQLPAWLATVPVPRLSTAFDPRTGRPIVPNEPLIGPVRYYLAADENSRGTEDTAHTEKNLYVVTLDLNKWLPDIYWTTVFGRPYVELFSRERLLSCPAYRVKELDNGSIVVQLTPELKDIAAEEAAFERVRQDARNHLDTDAFFNPAKGVDYRYRVPEFVWGPTAH